MDYETFERHFKRKAAAAALLDRIPKANRQGAEAIVGSVPSAAAIADLQDHWLPKSFHVCLRPDTACGGPDRCGQRCTAAYWRTHSDDVAEMMGRFAGVLGQDVDRWRAVGLLHDLDYLKGPHHDPDAPSEKAHPLAISTWLMENGAPTEIVLAVLEHSPHMGIEPSSLMSHALIACDEHATMTADGKSPEYPADIPIELLTCLSRCAPSFDGFVRDDMYDRAVAALRNLAAAL